ncbi:MAG TPA: hypothetical protein PKC69_07040 [Chitinophagaceae bacterium]|nr:hypothetical protein [Chitinophagaceae bacterium]
MKQVMLFLMAAMLFAACNQNTAGDNKKPGGGLFSGGGDDEGGDDLNNNTRSKSKGKWSSQDRNQFLKDCNASMPGGGQQASQICDCVLSKIEKEYSSLADADRRGGEAAGARITQACVQEIGAGDYTDDESGFDDGITDDRNTPRGGGNWTAQQRKQFIEGCSVDAKRNGLSSQQANAYCGCMTDKIARQFTFAQAAKLTANDLQTPQWQQAAAACMQGGGGGEDDYDDY